MATATSSRILRAALFVLVPAAYLSMPLWHPLEEFAPHGRAGVSPLCAGLMVAVLLVSLMSWKNHRLVAALGLLACLLWVGVTLLPVL